MELAAVDSSNNEPNTPKKNPNKLREAIGSGDRAQGIGLRVLCPKNIPEITLGSLLQHKERSITKSSGEALAKSQHSKMKPHEPHNLRA